MFICFVGIDGSGKTLQAKKLAERLEAQGFACDYIWCRYSPKVLMPLIKFMKRRHSGKKSDSEYNAYTSSKKGILSKPGLSFVWKTITSIEYLIQVTFTLRKLLRKDRILICDRYVYDMIADLSVNLGCKGNEIAGLMKIPSLRLLPVPDRVFFLDLPADVAFARKDDPNVMGKQYLVERADIYDSLCRNLGFDRIDGTKSIEEIADYVLSETIALAKDTLERDRN